MKKILIALIIAIIPQISYAGVEDLFNKKNFKSEYNRKLSNTKTSTEKRAASSLKKITKPELNFSLAGNINLYYKKEDQVFYPFMENTQQYDFFKVNDFAENPFIQALDKQAQDMLLRYTVKEPNLNSEILYKESQLLLQDFIQAQIDEFKQNKLDLVFFTGNQVYSNNQIDYFYSSLTDTFGKYQIPHYEVLGANEAQGQNDIKKEMGDLYYLLQTKKTNFIILNNLLKGVIPKNLPYEADEQYIWLKKVLSKLEKENIGEDLIIISYKEPDEALIKFISTFNHLNLVAFIYGEDYDYKEQELNNILFISAPSLSKYPCSYLKINRDLNGIYNFKEIKLNLPGIQELAKSKLVVKE